jgi:hypothetical protein
MAANNSGLPVAVPSVPAVTLCTLNAKYIHAALGLWQPDASPESTQAHMQVSPLAVLLADYRHSGAGARPAALRDFLPRAGRPNPCRTARLQSRQSQHHDGRDAEMAVPAAVAVPAVDRV